MKPLKMKCLIAWIGERIPAGIDVSIIVRTEERIDLETLENDHHTPDYN